VTDFEVDPPVLETFAGTSDGRRSSFDTEHQNIQNAHVAKESFGRIPGIGERIYQAYDQHVQACADGIASAAEAMAAIASGVRAVVANYKGSDDTAAHNLDTVHHQLDGVTIRGVK
jgi:hypothetical protein